MNPNSIGQSASSNLDVKALAAEYLKRIKSSSLSPEDEAAKLSDLRSAVRELRTASPSAHFDTVDRSAL